MPFRRTQIVYRCGKSFRTKIVYTKPKGEPDDKTGLYAAKAIGTYVLGSALSSALSDAQRGQEDARPATLPRAVIEPPERKDALPRAHGSAGGAQL